MATNQKHFVCPGTCQTVVNFLPKKCEDESCTNYDHPMIECKCEDDSHEIVRAAE